MYKANCGDLITRTRTRAGVPIEQINQFSSVHDVLPSLNVDSSMKYVYPANAMLRSVFPRRTVHILGLALKQPGVLKFNTYYYPSTRVLYLR
jgi:hypothetical protein